MRRSIPNHPPKIGQKVAAILYRGSSKVEADVIYLFLKTNYDNKTPIPVDKINLHMEITEVNYNDESDPGETQPLYMVTVRGVLV
jgi:hypothetical protein